MKLVMDIGGKTILLSADQLDEISAVLDGCEIITNKYIGGPSPNNYLEIVEVIKLRKSLDLRVMPTSEYEGMKMITKLHLEGEKK